MNTKDIVVAVVAFVTGALITVALFPYFHLVSLGEKGNGAWSYGLQDGPWILYYPDDGTNTEKKKSEGTFEKGTRVGKWTYWYLGGQKWLEVEYKNGGIEGRFKEWYENGQLKREGSYEGGKESKLWTFYHQNGKRRAEGEYRNGRQVGEWNFWDEAGRFTGNRIYILNELNSAG